MSVRVGSARHDENGKIIGGKAGDQKQKKTPDFSGEVSMQEWYLHSKGWVCIRAKSAQMREKIAKCMEAACNNPNIGYDQSENTTLRAVAKKVGYDCAKVTEKCETDCAKLVQVCIRYADFPDCPSFYTGSEVEVLKATGKFDILTADKYTTTSKYLLRGDILVTKVKGHTVVVLDDGSGTETELRRGSKGAEVKDLQGALNLLGYKDANGVRLAEDGSYGPKTEQAVKELQRDQGLKADGISGTITLQRVIDLMAAIKKVRVKTGLNLRKGYSTDYPIKAVLKAGAEVKATREKRGWLYLPEPDGWVNGAFTETI